MTFGVPGFEGSRQKDAKQQERAAADLIERIYERVSDNPNDAEQWITEEEADLIRTHGGEDGRILFENEKANGRYPRPAKQADEGFEDIKIAA
jgi:hypothetical protein